MSFLVLLISFGVISPVSGTLPPPKYDGTIGVVSIGFDHGFYSQWQPMMYLSSKNFSGSVFVVTTRTSQQNANLFPWSNLHTLYNMGYEMMSHSRLHLVETSGLSNATLYSEIYGSKLDLQNQGFNVCGFLPPTLARNATTMAVINKFYNYSSQLGINANTLFSISQSKNLNGIPYLLVMGTGDLDPTQLGYLQNFTAAKAQIDKAIQNKAFLHIHFHDIVNSTSDYPGLQYPVSFSWYKQTIDYIKQKSDEGVLKVETMSQAMGYGKQCEIVTDKTPPVISVPSGIILQTKLSSVKINYTATATDNVGMLNGPTCDPSSGSVFPVGNTTVTCTANDWAGNIGTKSFKVSIKQDVIPPSVNVPVDITKQAASSSGAQVSYTVTATDNIGVTSGPTCSPSSGAVFPIGNTTVACIASDAVGNVGTNSFKISVIDSILPSITVPNDIITQATSSSGAQVSYTVTATDNTGVVSGPTCNPSSGAVFPIGNTTVACTASDLVGNIGTGSFKVSVTNPKIITSLLLNPISDVPWGSKITVSGTLTNSATGIGVAKKIISFSGTGATNLPQAITNDKGFFTSSSIVSNTVLVGLTVQAHFAGDSFYNNKDSTINSYNILKHITQLTLDVPANVDLVHFYTISGTLKDFTTGKSLAFRTITFTTTTPPISNVLTDLSGKYIVGGLTVHEKGVYKIQANYAGDSLYSSTISPNRVLKAG